MPPRPARLAGLAVGLAALGVSAACASATPVSPSVASGPPTAHAQPSPSDSRNPLQDLTAAKPTENWPIFHFSIQNAAGGETGVIDPPDKIAEYVATRHFTKPTYTSTSTTLLTRTKAWLKVKEVPAPAGYVPIPKKWMLLDSNKIHPGGAPFVYGAESDPGFTDSVVENVLDLSESSPGHFTGLADLEHTNPDQILTAAQLKTLGDQAAVIHFTAILDAQGRLTKMSLTIPAAGKLKASTTVVTYDGFGTTAVPKLPATSDQTKAPTYIDKWFS